MAEASDPGPPKVSIGAPPGGPLEHNSGTPSPGGSPEGPPQGAPEGGPQGGPLEGPQEGDNRSDHEVYMEALKGLEGAPKMKLGLEDVKKVAAALGNPQDKYKVIHVAGTNGKGSVCLKVASCLMAKGYRVGVYSSPHILSLRERIKINNELIKERQFFVSFLRVMHAAKETHVSLSFFEICTLIALYYFYINNIDYCLLEVGLGGRYDATNFFNNIQCSIITSIGYDHMNILGNTLEEIATEKAQIIKPNTDVILGPSASPFSVFWEKSSSLHCDVWEVKGDARGDTFIQENNKIAETCAQLVLRLDLPPSRLAAALAASPPLRGQELTEQQLRVAARLCSSTSSSSNSSSNSNSSTSSTNINCSSSDVPPTAAATAATAAAAAAAAAEETPLPVPKGVIIDVGHNETALDRLFQLVGYKYYGVSIRLFCCISSDRSPTILRPALAQFLFPINNRLNGLYIATANHPRCQETGDVLQQILSNNKIDQDLRRVVEEGILQMSLWLNDKEQEDTQQQKQQQQQQQQQQHDYMKLAQQIRPGTLPKLLRKAFAAAAAEGSVLVVCGTFFMMREVMETLGLAEGPIDPVDMNEKVITPR